MKGITLRNFLSSGAATLAAATMLPGCATTTTDTRKITIIREPDGSNTYSFPITFNGKIETAEININKKPDQNSLVAIGVLDVRGVLPPYLMDPNGRIRGVNPSGIFAAAIEQIPPISGDPHNSSFGPLKIFREAMLRGMHTGESADPSGPVKRHGSIAEIDDAKPPRQPAAAKIPAERPYFDQLHDPFKGWSRDIHKYTANNGIPAGRLFGN